MSGITATASTRAPFLLNYRPEIDGLRAVAILPVVFYHAGIAGFSGGFVGVDVFFVISGYLITSIILHEKREGRFSLLNFYERRVRRIFPALFVMMAAMFPVAFLLLSPTAMKEFSGSVAASTVFVANVFFLRASGYFATAAELKPLLHNWSLSLEEQFYILFPAALLLTWRLGRSVQLSLFAVVAIASLAYAQWQVGSGDAHRAFFLLHTRIWELLMGVLAAFWLASERGQAIRLQGQFRHAALLGLAFILAAVFAYDSDTPFPGIAALVPCAGAALVIAFAEPRSLTGRLLSARVMVFVGLVNYSLYLWHYPLLAFTRISLETVSSPLLLAVCALSFVLACLSWRYVERPVRERRSWPRVKVFGAAALGIALLGGLLPLLFGSEAYRSYYLSHRLDAATRANYKVFQPQTKRREISDDGCAFGSRQLDQVFRQKFDDCARRHGRGILLIGDSHAENIYHALRADGSKPFLAALWRGGCRPYHPRPECPYDELQGFLAEHAGSVSQLVFQMSGSHLILDHLGKPDSSAAFVAGNDATLDLENIRNVIDYLSSIPVGPEVVWLGPYAEARVDLKDPANYSPEKLRFNPVSLDLFARLDALIKSETEGQTALRYVSLVDVMGLGANSLIINECLTFSDVDHLSQCGEEMFSTAIAEALR